MKVYKNKLGEYITGKPCCGNTRYMVMAADNMSDALGWYRVKSKYLPICRTADECERHLAFYARLRGYRYVFDDSFN